MKKAFTLVEVLVVVAIVAIVAAVLLPVFSRARQSSLEALSISNMRQLHLAIEQYRMDYGGEGRYGSQEEMALPDNITEEYLGPGVRDLKPPRKRRGWLYYYYPIPASIDRRRPTWAQYTAIHEGATVLLADPWFNPLGAQPPFIHYWMDPDVPKYLIGITLDGSIRRKTALGHLDLAWWD